MKFWTLVLASAITAILGCAVGGTRVTDTNNSLHTSHYELVVPPERGWNLRELREPAPSLVLTDNLQSGPNKIVFRIRVAENGIVAEALRRQSAKFIADDFRRYNRNVMVEEGVKTGQYTLSEVEMGEIEVGGKTFWTMKYRINQQGLLNHATMFLYFPKPSNNEHFLVILYSEAGPSNTVWTSKHKDDLMRILESVKAR